MSKFQPIEKEFDFKSVHFKQLKRDGLVCLYELNKEEWINKNYEVVILKEVNETRWPNGTVSPPRETMPNSESWGDNGWSLTTKELALKKFDEVIEMVKSQVGIVKKRGRKKKI